ncbi:MAG: M23 family metallopeptidase [Asticcacaulis sp.]
MTQSVTSASTCVRFTARWLLAGLSGVAVLALQACATTDMPQPKYPIYMQDKPAAESPAPAPDTVPPAATSVDTTPATTPLPHDDVATNDLPPPPPPPSPADVTPPAATAAPAPPPSAPVRDTGATYVYVMQAHDTLYGVSRRFGVPVKQLYDINALTADATFRIGQRILLPATAADKGTEEHANGTGMVKLNVAVASNGAPAAPPKPVPAAAKPVTVAAAAPAKSPVVTPPAKPPVTTPVAAPPVKPVVVATTTPAKPPVVTPAPPSAKPATSTVAVAPAAPGVFPTNPQISQMGRGMFVWPVRGKIVVPFGQLAPNVRNDGINIAADAGNDVVAAADGVVVYEGDQVKELGNTIYVKHPGGWYTGYSHLATMAVKNNEKVTKGEIIGTVGQTGVIDRPQLHFEIRYTPSTDIAKPIDPNLVLP